MVQVTKRRSILSIPWANIGAHISGEMAWPCSASNSPILNYLRSLDPLGVKEMNKHAVIDIETLGTGSKAAIIEIGAVVFDPDTLVPMAEPPATDTFYKAVDLQF